MPSVRSTVKFGLLMKTCHQPFPEQALVCMCLQYKSFENIVGKGEIAHIKQFLFFPQCFLTFWITFSHVYQISNCHLQTLSVWKILKFVVWERVNLRQLTLSRLVHRITALLSLYQFFTSSKCNSSRH